MKEFNPSNVLFVRQALPEKTAADLWQALAGWLGALPEGKGFAFEVLTEMLEGEDGKEERAHLVEAHAVAAVISLPIRSMDGEWMDANERARRDHRKLKPKSLIILTKSASVIRMAALEREKAFHNFWMAELPDEKALALANEEGVNVFDIATAKILENDASLLPAHYVEVPIGTCRRVALGEVASVNRGFIAMQRIKEASDTPTNCRALRISTMLGPISEMPYLKSISEKDERYCVQAGDIVLSRIPPYRIRLLEDLEGQQILADSNIIMLRVQSETLLPIILFLYLQSEEGQTQLGVHSRGSSHHALALRGLEMLQVPVPGMEHQKAIAARYEELTKQVAEAEKRVQQLREEIGGLMKGL